MLQTSGRWRSSKARHCHGCGCCNCCNGHPAGKKTPVGPGRSHGEMAGFSNWSTGACSQVLYPQRSPLTGLFLFIWVARSATPISKKLQPCSEHWPFMDVGKKCPLFPPATEDSGPAPCSDRRTPGHDCPSATEYPLQALRWQPSPDQWVGSTKIQYPAPPKKLLGTFSSYLIRASTAVYCSIPKFPRILLVTSNLAFQGFLHSFFWGACVNILRRDGRAPSHFDWHRHVSGYIKENWQLGRRKRWLVRGIIPELKSVFLFPLIWE